MMRRKTWAALTVAALLLTGCAEDPIGSESDLSADAMLACAYGIEDNVPDPDSVKIWEYKPVSESANAWYYDIDFTTTNSQGGPSRVVWRCAATANDAGEIKVSLTPQD